MNLFTNQVRNTRLRLMLTSASAALLVFGTGAASQTVEFTLDAGFIRSASVTDRGTSVVTTQELRDNVLSSIESGTLAQSSSGTVGTSSVDISANALLATARGNLADTSGQLLGDTADGRIGLLTGQVAANSVTANVNSSAISAVLSTGDNATSASFVASGNQLDARSTINEARTIFADDISANLGDLLASDTTSVTTATLRRGDSSARLVDVDGASSVVASSQVITRLGTSSTATANDNALSLDLRDSASTSNVTDSALAIDANQIRATLTGNAAVAGTDLAVDTDFSGTGIVLSQQQIGEGADTIALSAIADSNALSIDLTDETGSSVSVSQNVIGASASGNIARDGAGSGTFLFVEANQISTNGEEARVSFATPDALILDGAFVAGTQQQILGSSGVLGATNTDSTLAVTTADVAGSVVDLARNTLFATATGNDAASAISLNGTSVDASAALGNQQSVDTSIGATLGNGTDPSALSATIEGTLTDASVAIDANVLLGQAEANSARNQLSVTSDTTIAQTSPNNRAALFTTDADARGGFVLGNEQTFAGVANTLTSAVNTDLIATIGTLTAVGDISSSSVSISDNQQSSVARVNQVQNGLDLTALSLGTGTEAVSSILSSRQDVDIANVAASSVLDSEILQENYTTGVGAFSISGSSLTVDGNENRSTVSANEAENRLATNSASEIVGNLILESRADLSEPFSIGATSVLANEQSVTASSLDADAVTNATFDGNVGSGAAGIEGSNISISDNLTAAAANGNTANSVIVQSAGTESGATAALRNVQTTDVANTTADAIVQLTTEARGTATDTSFAIDNNQLFASTAGNSAQSSIVVDVTSFDGPADSIAYNAFFDAGATELGQARADFAILSDQSQTGALSATANVDAELRIRPTAGIGGFLTDSTASINNTLARANALANEADNSVGFAAAAEATDISAALASRQLSDGVITATAVTDGTTDELSLSVRRGLVDSSASIDGNVFVADAGANVATNRVSLEGLSLTGATLAADFADLGARLDLANDLVSARADASLVNLQETAATGSITAFAELDAGLTTIDFDLERSSASVSSNFLRASGQANEADNIVNVLAESQSVLTSAVANLQNNLAAIDVDSIFDSTIAIATLRADGNSGLLESVLTLDDNFSVALANGNTATSLLVLDGSVIDGLSIAGQSASVAIPIPALTISRAIADNVVSSQQVSGAAISATSDSRSSARVRGDIELSSVSLSGNIGQTNAIANSAINGADLQASTSASGTTAVTNQQLGIANIVASTEIDVVFRQDIELTAGGPQSIAQSALLSDANLAISSAQGNLSTNSLSVAAATVSGRSNATDLTVNDGSITGFATNRSDNILANDQSMTGGAAITSSANIVANSLLDSDDGTGTVTSVRTSSTLADSSVSVSGNVADSTASANRSANTVALNADAKLEASAGLVNTQANENAVSSAVQLTTRVGTTSLGDVTNSSVALNGNVGVARANGNDAVNRMSATSATEIAGSPAVTSAAATVNTGAQTVLNSTADFAMVSNQTNTGSVTARASTVGLPTTFEAATGGTVLNSSLSLSGNTLVADASSNRSVNQMTVSGRSPSENVSVAVANRQVASGAVTSGVDNFRVSSISGAVSGSSIRVGGNRLSASASGNTGSVGLSRD